MGKGVSISVTSVTSSGCEVEVSFGDGASASYSNVPPSLAMALQSNPGLYNSALRGQSFPDQGLGAAIVQALIEELL